MTAEELVAVRPDHEPQQFGNRQRSSNGPDERRPDAAPGEPYRPAAVAALLEHGPVGGLGDLHVAGIRVGPDRARRRGCREGMQIDAEIILLAPAEPRFDDSLKSHILDGL